MRVWQPKGKQNSECEYNEKMIRTVVYRCVKIERIKEQKLNKIHDSIQHNFLAKSKFEKQHEM